MGEPLRVGLIGTGRISSTYVHTLQQQTDVQLVAAADRDIARAVQLADSSAADFAAMTVEQLLQDPSIDVILNLTTPASHADIALRALAAGKSVYGEKPLAATISEGRKVLAVAKEHGLRVACAPDTVLGVGIQTARRAVDDAMIGTPFAASAVMAVPGHERWHHDPEFYYRPGGGPLLDMGPYYVSALVHLLGPVTDVTGVTSRPRPQRTIGSGPRAGTTFETEIDTHVTGVLTHSWGALSTILMSFDAVGSRAPRIEIHGTEGTLAVPDPNRFDGESYLRRFGSRDWEALPYSAGYRNASRGIGLADMARAIASEIPHRASSDLAYHALDVMESFLRSAEAGHAIAVESTCHRPEPVILQRA